jgi:hypothetical protein
MKNHLLKKLHPNSTGEPVEDFQNPQKPNRTKDTGLLRSRGGGEMEKYSNLLVAHHLLDAPLVTEKKIGFEFFFGFFFQNMIRNMTGKFEIFFQNFITLMNMNKVLDINKV